MEDHLPVKTRGGRRVLREFECPLCHRLHACLLTLKELSDSSHECEHCGNKWTDEPLLMLVRTLI